jgi:hypothetical protein
MFHIRWHSSFQDSYGRGDSNLDGLFNKLLDGKWEGSFVGKTESTSGMANDDFPKKLDESVDDSVVERMVTLYTYVVEHQGAPVAGASLASMEANYAGEDDGCQAMDGDDYEEEEMVDGYAVTSVHSPHQRHLLSQQEQSQAIEEMNTPGHNAYQSGLKDYNSLHDIADNSPTAKAMIAQGMQKIREDVASYMRGRNMPASSQEVAEGDGYDVGAISYDNRRTDRRYRYSYEGA